MRLSIHLLTLLLFACTAVQAKADGIVINELQVANVDMFVDPSFNYGGWIELFNPTDEDFDLGECYVSESSEDLMQFQLPKDIGIVPAHGFKVLWFDHNSLDGNFSKQAYKQIRFKLSYEGGTVYISDPSGHLLLSQSYPEALTRCSYGRTEDGGTEWKYTGEPTPGTSNTTSTFCTQRVAAPKVKADSGIHSSSVHARVEKEDGVTIIYTTDGTTPTLTNGTVMTKSFLSVGKTTVMRFRGFRDGWLPSPVVTQTYLFNDRTYSLPILSIATDPVNLYSDSIGIEVSGVNGFTGNGQGHKVNFNADWERPVNMEYISPTGEPLLNQEVDMYMCGGYSRGTTPRSFKLKASRVYEGQNALNYPFFSTKPYNKYKVLQFRNGGNDSNCRVKDVIIQDIIQSSDVYVDGQASQAVHILVNGQYYGMLNMREPSNKYNGYINYGYDVDDMEAFDFKEGKYTQKAGDKTFFEIWEVLAETLQRKPDAYHTSLRNIVDIDEYANYMAIKTFMGNSDWYTNNNNIKGYRLSPDGKFHMAMFDEDSAFDYGDIFVLFKNEKNVFIKIFNDMIVSEDFRRHFITSFMLADGSIFQTERSKEIINRIGQERESALAIEKKEPWATCNSTLSKMQGSNFHSERQKGLRTYFSLGKGYSLHLFSNIPEAVLLMNDQQVPTGKFNGKVFIPTTITATAPVGYEFLGWKTGTYKDDETATKMLTTDRTIEPPANYDNCNLMACFSPIEDKYLIAAHSTPVVINEISAGNTIFINDYFKKNDWIELYNTTSKDIDLTGMYISDDPANPYKYQIEPLESTSKAIIHPHDYFIIWADKLDPLTQLHSTFKLSNNDDESVILTAADGSWQDVLTYPAHKGTESVGRFPDAGSQVFKFHRPTIAKRNFHTTYDVHLSGENANYDPFTSSIDTLALQAEGTTIEYYTLDGMRLQSPRRGINIIRQYNSDGTTITRKVVIE